MAIDPVLVAVPSLLTILLCVKFLVSGIDSGSFKLVGFAFLVSFIWVDSFLRFKYPRKGLGWMVTHPDLLQETHSWTRNAAPFILIIGWGLVIYWMATADN
jgi:hypothetical protein